MTSEMDDGIPLLAWRSITISVFIAVVASILYVIALDQVLMALVGVQIPTWCFYLQEFFMRYGIVFPICLGAFYLAVRVRRGWVLNAFLYLAVFTALVLIRYLISHGTSSITLQLCYRIFLSCPIALLMRLPARWLTARQTLLGASSNERIRFGIPTLFWGCAIVALVAFLLSWHYKSAERFFSAQSLESLQQQGAIFDAANNRLSINSQYQSIPIRLRDAAAIQGLGKKIVVDFSDCELTDETIAFFKSQRQTFGKIQFRDCKVVKEAWPSNIITIGNELNEPLPSELPR